MILLWGLPDETPIARVADELRRLNAAFCFLDQRRYSRTAGELSIGNGTGSGWLATDDQRIDLGTVTGAYLRPYPLTPATGPTGTGHAEALDQLILTWAGIAPPETAVLNRPDAMATNDSKPHQTELIRAHGFAVPDTIVTTDPVRAEQFWDQHGMVVYKSTSGVRSIANLLTERHRARLAHIPTCPTQLQQFVPGDDYRVHTAGARVFATRIVSDAIDYRYAGRQGADRTMEPAHLPPDIADRCVRMTRNLGLLLAGIDLRLTPGGTWYCFEVNTSPAFTWFEDHTGQPIAHAIAQLLVHGPAGCSR